MASSPEAKKKIIGLMLKNFAVRLICFYQSNIKGMLVPACRFVPSCSEYAKEALEKHGFFKGATMALLRILRCHPLNRKTGWDPVK
jgi:putative membrane protein insertion efficiency factor